MPAVVPSAPLSQRILDAAEAVLRRHGVEKTNVVDIARSLGMSHGNIYRHFPSKQALLDAVAVRWLHAVSDPLETIADDRARPAAERLSAWFDTLRKAKRRKVRDDPELFQVYHGIVMAMREVVDEHVAILVGQLERIIADGMTAGEFARRPSAAAMARAFMQATMSFHHPALVMRDPPATDADARTVFGLVLAGLRADPA